MNETWVTFVRFQKWKYLTFSSHTYSFTFPIICWNHVSEKKEPARFLHSSRFNTIGEHGVNWEIVIDYLYSFDLAVFWTMKYLYSVMDSGYFFNSYLTASKKTGQDHYVRYISIRLCPIYRKLEALYKTWTI